MTAARQSARETLTRIWVTRDRYENPLSYSIWSVEPILDRDGHWARHDPKRLGTDVRQVCSAKVAEAVIGHTLTLGAKVGPIVGISLPADYDSAPPTTTPRKTQASSAFRHKGDRSGPGTAGASS
jgi:hypothetical protein